MFLCFLFFLFVLFFLKKDEDLAGTSPTDFCEVSRRSSSSKSSWDTDLGLLQVTLDPSTLLALPQTIYVAEPAFQ